LSWDTPIGAEPRPAKDLPSGLAEPFSREALDRASLSQTTQPSRFQRLAGHAKSAQVAGGPFQRLLADLAHIDCDRGTTPSNQGTSEDWVARRPMNGVPIPTPT
jgi:hypothetical protein